VLNGQKVKSPWNRRDHWLLNDPGQAKIILSQGRETYECSLERRETEYSLKWHKESLSFSYKATNGQYVLTSSGKEVMFEGVIVENHLVLFRDGHVFDFTIGAPQESREILEESQGHLMAPMPGKVIALHVKKGDSVKQGEPLVAMEAMKMEHGIHAPFDGTIIAIPCELGEIVEEGRELVQMEPKAK
ncbi:MAG: hypothetical protein HOK20_05930, partial [Alphaproteobacteria bacterium]|nr:hypothetical protein [Alphaproteobacteria bacterium]